MVVLLYDSSQPFYDTYQATFMFELCAMVFDELKMDSIEFWFLDVNNQQIPDFLKSDTKTPKIILAPANHKSSVPFPETSADSMEKILEFIATKADSDVVMRYL